MSEIDTSRQLAEAQATIRALQEELNETQQGVLVLMMELEKRVEERTAELSAANAQLRREIDEHRQAEEALRESEARFRSVLDGSRDIIYRLNVRTGRYEYISPAAVSVSGYSAEELMAMDLKTTMGMVHADDRAAMQAGLARMEETGLGQLEYRQRTKDGDYRWISNRTSLVRDGAGRPLYRDGNIRDITERKRAEEALRHSMRRFEILAEINAELLQSRDPQKSVEALCRKVMEHLDCHAFFNFLVDETVGRLHLNACAGIPEEESRKIEWLDYGVAVCGCAARDACHIVAEHIPATPDPRTELVKSYGIKAYACHPLLCLEGKVIGTLSFGTRSRETFSSEDLSLMKAVADSVAVAMMRISGEQALRELNGTLEQRVGERTAEVQKQADQLRALASELSQAEQRERKRLATILHDHIQQLLVAARMQVEWLKRDNNPERRHAGAQGLDGILKEALEASRSLTVELSPPVLHTAGLIGGLDWLASRMREKNQFAVHLHADNKAEPPSEAARFLLFECVRELLLNSMKHSGLLEAHVMLLRTKNARIKLIVRDQGKGFDPDLLKNRRANEASFGLFSIEQRLTHIGGEMYIETAPGKGTTVTLTIPAGAELSHAKDEDELARKEERISKVIVRDKTATRHVLIVDDHKIMREGLVGLMQFEPDIEVVGQATDGPQAIEMAGQLQPDVIIMDINLGDGMNGVEATKRILAANPNIKVIGLSMHTDNNIATALRDAGAVAYLTKGGPSEGLVAAIRACSQSRTISS